MAVNYYKKKQFYQIASELLQELYPGIKIPKMIDANYRFYRGTEWLRFDALNQDLSFDFCHMSRHISIDVFSFDDFGSCKDIDRICFVVNGADFQKTYHRTELK